MMYGTRTGDMPPGTMRISYRKNLSCDGYPGVGTFIILYHFPNGERRSEPGTDRPPRSYKGTTREAYIPATEEGKEVCILLQIAFIRKLTFTVGRSLTTGQNNVVVWNSIHHKTNLHGGTSAYGYPDPTYFNRVKNELAANGVFEKDITDEHRRKLNELMEDLVKSNTRVKRGSGRTAQPPATFGFGFGGGGFGAGGKEIVLCNEC